jgi:hypothetical protein
MSSLVIIQSFKDFGVFLILSFAHHRPYQKAVVKMSVDAARTRTLHSKRSFGKYPRMVDSPAYDAQVDQYTLFPLKALTS